MKAKVIIERGTDGSFSAYLATKTLPFGLIGEGKTAQETREDFLGGYEDTSRVCLRANFGWICAARLSVINH